MLTVKEQLELIKTEFETKLPGLLTTAGLTDFNQYLAKPPLKSNDLELCVIQCQLYNKKDLTAYFDVIKPFILKNITPYLLELENRNELEWGIYHMDENKTNSLILFGLSFDVSLDDCED
jgi:hypothetical protein